MMVYKLCGYYTTLRYNYHLPEKKTAHEDITLVSKVHEFTVLFDIIERASYVRHKIALSV